MILPKDYVEFEETWANGQPDSEWPDVLKALWYDATDDWHKAHEYVDQSNTPMAKWIHAYLHRKEGDTWNAGYWYRQAGKHFPETGLEQEFKAISETVLRSIQPKH